jgi:hypothetical protein
VTFPSFSFLSIATSRLEKQGKAAGDSVIATSSGDADCGYDAEVYQGHGIVSRPSNKTKGIRIRLGSLSIIIAAYTYGVDPPENPGATKIYATDADGAEKGSHLLDSDGTHIFNEGEDFAVRFSALKTAFDELQSKFNSHVHSGVSTGGGSSAVTPTPSTADISGAKVEEIQIP